MTQEIQQASKSLDLKKLLIGLIILSSSISANSQYKSEKDLISEREDTELAQIEDKAKYLIGRTYWIKPNPKAIQKIRFLDIARESGAEKFYITEDTNFKIISIEKDYPKNSQPYFKVKFQDGKSGYLAINLTTKKFKGRDKILEALIGDNEPMYDFQEYIFPSPPEKFISAYKLKQAEILQANKSKAGVRIGMTTSEVLNSKWGKPLSINRTTTAFGTREQWVYGSGNYLYFDNNILSGIQN